MRSKRTYYLAGPMSNIKDHNFPAFIEHENELRHRGLMIVSPREESIRSPAPASDNTWGFYLKQDIKLLLDCDAIILMPDWETSRGARLECTIADKLGMFVYSVNSEYQIRLTRYGNQNDIS